MSAASVRANTWCLRKVRQSWVGKLDMLGRGGGLKPPTSLCLNNVQTEFSGVVTKRGLGPASIRDDQEITVTRKRNQRRLYRPSKTSRGEGREGTKSHLTAVAVVSPSTA